MVNNFAKSYGIIPMTSNVDVPVEKIKRPAINLFDFSQKSTVKPTAM
jgi:hypothetical protein